MADNEQHYLEVQVIPGTPPPPSLLTLEIPNGSHSMTIHRQQSSPLWSGESNDSYNYDFTQFAGADDFVGSYSDELPILGSSSASGAYLSPGSPSSSGSFSPLLDSFQDFSIASSSPVASSPLMPSNLAFDGSDLLPFTNFEQASWTKSSSDFLTPALYAPSPQRSFSSPGSSFSDLSPDLEASGSTSLARRHSHHSHSQSLDYLRSSNNPQLPLRRTRSISGVRSRSPYDRSDSSSLLTVPSPSRSPAPPFPEPEIPNYSPEISITAPSDDSDEATTRPAPAPREQIASAAVLRASEKRRTKTANFQCPFCSNCLTSKDNLNNHIDAHNNVRRHGCDRCGEKFRTRSVLRRHQNSNKCKSRVKSANGYVSKVPHYSQSRLVSSNSGDSSTAHSMHNSS